VRLPRTDAEPVLGLAVVANLLFFASVLAHEVACSPVARRRGISVQGIRLFIFGGELRITDEPQSVRDEPPPTPPAVLTSLFPGLALGPCGPPLGDGITLSLLWRSRWGLSTSLSPF